MIISDDTKYVVDFLEQYSDNTLRKKNDVAVLLEISAINNNFKLINHIIFTGASIYKISRNLKKAVQNSELLKNELENSIIQLQGMLKDAIDGSNLDVSKRFDVTYLAKSSGSYANIIDLAYDLSILKNLQMRRSELFENVSNDL